MKIKGYVARDENKEIFVYRVDVKKSKYNKIWVPKKIHPDIVFFKLHTNSFPNVKWTNKKPTEVMIEIKEI